MKIGLTIIGAITAVAGLIFFLQGINVLPGSFMTGKSEWALYGSIAMLLGAGLVIIANRQGKQPPDS
jgi:hypothetical protein